MNRHFMRVCRYVYVRVDISRYLIAVGIKFVYDKGVNGTYKGLIGTHKGLHEYTCSYNRANCYKGIN